jgi:hypothetical protein
VDIDSILSKLNRRVSEEIVTIKAKGYEEKYSDLSKHIFGFSKNILEREGIIENPNITPTDKMLAKAILKDVCGGGWEGSGQAIKKMFSIITGVDLSAGSIDPNEKAVLPKGCFVKFNNEIGFITEKGNLATKQGDSLAKYPSYNRTKKGLELPTEKEILYFIGEVFETATLKRNLNSILKVNDPVTMETMLKVSENGHITEREDEMLYQSLVARALSNPFNKEMVA